MGSLESPIHSWLVRSTDNLRLEPASEVCVCVGKGRGAQRGEGKSCGTEPFNLWDLTQSELSKIVGHPAGVTENCLL